jgi:hypothetical protein
MQCLITGSTVEMRGNDTLLLKCFSCWLDGSLDVSCPSARMRGGGFEAPSSAWCLSPFSMASYSIITGFSSTISSFQFIDSHTVWLVNTSNLLFVQVANTIYISVVCWELLLGLQQILIAPNQLYLSLHMELHSSRQEQNDHHSLHLEKIFLALFQ